MTQPANRSGRNPRAVTAGIMLIILAASLACGLPFGGNPTPRVQEAASPTPPPAQPTATPQPLPPGLIESDPPIDGELPLSGPITLYFNQPMDHASVEAALTGQMQQELTFTWVDDSTVVVYVSREMSPETALAFNLSGDIRSKQGLSLTQPVRLSFTTAGYLHPEQALPEDGSTEVDPTSAVVASFNRPVVPLGADPAALPAGFSLDPASPGNGTWLNTSTYIFYPEPALVGGRTYRVTINPDLKSTDGAPLQQEYSWSFTTTLPELISIEPSTETPWQLDPQVTLTFNQPMDRSSAEAHFSLSLPDGRPVTGQFAWEEDDTVAVFTPQGLLPRNTTLTLSLSSQTQSVGGTALGSDQSFSVITMPELSVGNSQPTPGGTVDPLTSLQIFFTSWLPTNQDLTPFVSLEPAVSDLNTSADQQTLYVMGNLKPNTEYLLKISPELKDAWGSALGQEYQLSFRTNPLAPNLSILSGAEAIFLTPQDLGLVVQAVNLSEVPLTVGGVPLNDLFTLLGPNGYEIRKTYQGVNPTSWTQSLDLPSDQTQAVPIYLNQQQQALQPGIYFVRLNFDGEQTPALANIYPGPYLVVISNAQLTFKLSMTNALVWAVDLRNRQPLPNAPVTLYTEDGGVLASGQTDNEGIFKAEFARRSDPYSTVFAALGEPGQEIFGMAFSNWTYGIEPWDFDIQSSPDTGGPFVYLYTDRPIYRPGQTVYFRAVLREASNGRYSLASQSSLPITIFDAQGRELTKVDLPLTAFGTAHGEFNLPSDIQPGSYSMTSPQVETSYLEFMVASYRKPEINLTVEFTQAQALAGDQLEAQIEARYFFDAPAGNLPVRWALYSVPEGFNLPGYQVGPQNLDWLEAFQYPDPGSSFGNLVSEGSGETDPQGKLVLQFPTQLNDERQRYTLEATIVDESGLPVSARDAVDVDPETFFIGLRPDVWVSRAGEPLGFDVQTVDANQKPAPQISLRGVFQKVIFDRKDPQPDDPYGLPVFTPRYTPIGSTDFVTSGEGLARLSFSAPEPGTYMLDVFNPARPEGQGTRTQILMWIGGEGQAVWPNLPNSRLRLTADRDSYKPGDTAQIFIPNPYNSPTLALLTIERGVIMDDMLVQVAPGGYNLSLPLTDTEAPNVILSATLLGQGSNGVADFRQGFINLPVAPLEQTLNVRLLSTPEHTAPGEEVRLEIQVSDAAGQPVQGEFSLSLVDLAVLALADPNSKDIVPAFYGEQPLSVRTSLSLAVYNRRMLNLPLGLGGGGGEEAPVVTRERFPDTAYWNAEVVTDAEGKASVTLTLPDTLTTWQVETRGLTLDTRVGQALSQVITSKELLVRPVTPRFAVANDHVQLAAVVQNTSGNDMQVQAALQATGCALDDPSKQTQTLSVPAGGRARVEWWGTVQEVEKVDLIFSAEGRDGAGNAYQDAARPAQGVLPVLRFIVPQTMRTAGTLDAAGETRELVSLPRSFTPSGGGLTVELSPSLASALIRAMDALETASFASTERILSSFLPNLETYRTLQDHGIDDANLKARLDRTLNEGLVRLLARQNYDGGWGWWESGESDPYISAYVMFGLQRSRLAGVSISQVAIDQGLTYLKESSLTPDQADPEHVWQWDRQAFEQFTLAQYDAADPAVVDRIFEARDRLSPWAQALLVLTLEDLSPGGEQARALLTSLQASPVRSATGAYWEFSQDPEGLMAAGRNMHTNLSNTAIVIYMLAQRDPGAPLVTDAARYLMANREANGAWNSTYTTAWSLIGLDQVLKGTGELGGQFAFGATLNANPIADGTAGGADQLTTVTALTPIQRLYPNYPNALVIERGDGPGRLYYTAGLEVNRPVEETTPLSLGLAIEREVYPFGEACEKGSCASIQSAQVGDKVNVRLTLTLPNDRYFLAVSDYIPAGAEILNVNLKTTEMGLGVEPGVEPVFNPRRPFARGWGWWLFNQPQIYDDHIAWTVENLPAGTYELTYTLALLQPGEFRVLPARAWQLYFPETQANSAGSLFTINP
ncbi:MAG: Ig-like domain-containing protein [Anaerolineales bacterium]|jgi:uncharacterized protein YfaS (alpha-2-macroglobulin family)|nr:Ig-like domain-containing protein [Anaerolineales bacterium]